MNDRLKFSQRVQRLEGAVRAAIAYDKAIKDCANSPQSMSSWCTAQGDSLDVLYADWVSKSRAALAVVAAPVPAQEPFMFAIMTPDGSAHMDENCVGPDAASLYSELNGLNDSPDAGYAIVPLYRFPVQPVAVPVGWISERTIDSLANARDFAKVPYHHSSTIFAAQRPNGSAGEACTVPVFAATAALPDTKGLMDKVIRVLEGYAENYDMMSRIGKTGDVDCKSVAHDIRRNMVDGVCAAIAGKAVAP